MFVFRGGKGMRSLISCFLALILLLPPFLAYDDIDPIINYFEVKPLSLNVLQITWSIDDNEALASYKILKNGELLYQEKITGTHYVSVYQDSSYNKGDDFTYKLIVYDRANNSAEKTYIFNSDNVPPKIVSGLKTISNQKVMKIQTDEESMCFFGYDSTTPIIIEEEAKKEHSVPLANIVEGSNIIYVKCTDIYNNEMPSFVAVNFEYDITDPSKISDPTYTVENGSIKISWSTATDKNGILKYNIYDEEDNLLDSTSAKTWLTNRNLSKYYISAVDNAGNEGAKTRVDINVSKTNNVENKIQENKTITQETKEEIKKEIKPEKSGGTNLADINVMMIAVISWIVLGIAIVGFIIWKVHDSRTDRHGLRSYMARRRRLRNFKVKFRI